MATLIKASTARTRAGKVNVGDIYVGYIADSILETVEQGEFKTSGYAPEEYQAYVRNTLLAAGYDILPAYNYKNCGFGVITCGYVSEPKSIWEKFLDLFGSKEPDYAVAVEPEPEVSDTHFIVSWAKAPDETQPA